MLAELILNFFELGFCFSKTGGKKHRERERERQRDRETERQRKFSRG
jgi:hypothetical protein